MENQTQLDFDGAHHDPEIDRDRLTGQIMDVYNCLLDGKWWTVEEIQDATGHPQASISAQLRNLRKDRYGGHDVMGRYRKNTNRIFEYKL